MRHAAIGALSILLVLLVASPPAGAAPATSHSSPVARSNAPAMMPAVYQSPGPLATATARVENIAYVHRRHRRHYRAHRRVVVVHRRSRKRSAEIIGGSALGGAAIGALAGGGKGAAIGAGAGAGAGFVYDRATHKKKRVVRR